MKHFSPERFCDFVRGLSPAPDRAEMQAHLESGCAECKREVAWLHDLARASNIDREIEVPHELVVRARAIFQFPEPKDWVDRLQSLVGDLVFAAGPAYQAVGVRSMDSDERRLLFRAGVYTVDLNIEPLDGSGREIVGQITNEGDEQDCLEGALVQLISAGRTIGEAETNQFGEFIIERLEGRNMVIRIALRAQGMRIDLPIQNN